MDTTLEHIIKRITSIDKDVSELNRLKGNVPASKAYSSAIQLSFDKHINELLNERMSLIAAIENNAIQMQYPLLRIGNQQNLEKLFSNFNHGDLSVRDLNEQDVLNFIRNIPKTEIHLHLEACVNKNILRNLIKKNKIRISNEAFEEKFNFNDLNGFIDLFLFIQSVMKSPEDLGFMIDSLAHYLRSNNIIYSEVFFAPSKFIKNGMNFFAMIDVLVEKIQEIKNEDGTEIRLLVDVSRSFGPENAMENLKNVMKVKQKEVIGIGLGGAELIGPAKDYEKVFLKAKDAGMRTVAHAGEDDGPWSIWDSLLLLHAERIGHGTSAIQDQRLVGYLKEHQIPVEICLTSNVFTGKYVVREQDHPVRYYYDYGLMTTINTDDPEIFNVNLNYEYFKLYRFLNFSIDELIDLVRIGVYSTFYENKDALWKKIEDKIDDIKPSFKLIK
ncbi:MAG: adenosine deaminase [Leptospiraceae bacterium]|nr:adenosine deaminase [Leptospiraceae bacterium]MCP5494348.1 adenosine deaminase [Leptospiraceae bacterium]